jgi:uncharacterized protein YraI
MMTQQKQLAVGVGAAILTVMVGAVCCWAEKQTTTRPALLRQGPGAFYPVVARLEPGAEVSVLKRADQWLEGHLPAGQGWLPEAAFKRSQAGADYAGLLHGGKAMLVSSVDLAAATKGAFEASYSETHKVSFDVVNELDALILDPKLVVALAAELTGTLGDSLYGRIPLREFDNDLVLKPDAEQVLGRAFAAQIMQAPLIADKKRLAYVNAVAALVGAKTQRYDLYYRVAVLQDSSINGFGLPGGYIVLTAGLLDALTDEAELACVLGHEMAHTSLYHGLREFRKRDVHRRRDSVFDELEELADDGRKDTAEDELKKLADTGYLKIIGARAREDELEADVFGIAYAAAAGYDPKALARLLERLSSQVADGDDFRHHPPLADRLAVLNQIVGRYRLAKPGQQRLPERFARHVARATNEQGLP